MASDLISRAALLDIVENKYSDIVAGRYPFNIVAYDLSEIIKKQPTVGGWIPCNEELPPKPERNPLFEGAKVELYLVSVGEEFYPFRVFWNGKDFTDGFSKVDAEAWMPLPEPYKEGDIDG